MTQWTHGPMNEAPDDPMPRDPLPRIGYRQSWVKR